MILIRRAQNNIIVVTLKEAIKESVISSPYYLFAFQNDQSREVKYCISVDESLFKDRYSKFQITETETPIYTSSQVDLDINGFWSYQIYEQSSSTNLDPANSDNTTPIEIGKVQVLGSEAVAVEYNYNYNNTVYNG